MARLPRSGATTSALCEHTPAFEELVAEGLVDAREATTTLTEVLADMGLKPLSDEDEQRVRDSLGMVVGRGWALVADSPRWTPDDNFTVADVQATLVGTAEGLEAMIAGCHLSPEQLTAIEKVLLAAETGFRESFDTAVATRVIGALRQEIGHDKARERVIEFRTWPCTVAAACRRAAAELDGIEGKAGKQCRDWYPAFVGVLAFVAEKNGIEPNEAVFNPRTGTADGRFLHMAERFEQLLPRHMRSASRVAIVRTLKRSKAGATD
jgi:hypothetical protein